MNPWMRDPRVEKSELDGFEAERAERRGDPSSARALYHGAADGYAQVALGVPADYPNTRSDLAIAAVACFARAGDFGRAVEFARRVLAERDALTDDGAAEIERISRSYAALLAPPSATEAVAPRGIRLRDEVRGKFKRAA